MSDNAYESYSTEEWNSLRNRFEQSALIDTEMKILGQNAGKSWPFTGSDETPRKYIEFTLEELGGVPGLIGKKSRIKRLMDILRETLAFDDPFSDLVDSVELDGVEDHTFERILAKFNIPIEFPAKLINFTEVTFRLLGENASSNLIEVIKFGQRMPQNAPEGEELRLFLNSLALMDEVGMARHLPYRRGDRGLYLPEEIGLIAKKLSKPVQIALVQQAGLELSEDEAALLEVEQGLAVEGELKRALEMMSAACDWFTREAEQLQAVFSSDEDPNRYFIPIQNPEVERIALSLARIHFGFSGKERSGIVGKISSLFKR